MNEEDARNLIEQILASSTSVRYVATYQGGFLVSRQREMVESASQSASDRYEELLVNPALLTLAKQRGDIDCGGLRFLIVAYGHFYQLVQHYKQGHISICIESARRSAGTAEHRPIDSPRALLVVHAERGETHRCSALVGCVLR